MKLSVCGRFHKTCALCRIFKLQKASQKHAVEHKICPTFDLYEIHPWSDKVSNIMVQGQVQLSSSWKILSVIVKFFLVNNYSKHTRVSRLYKTRVVFFILEFEGGYVMSWDLVFLSLDFSLTISCYLLNDILLGSIQWNNDKSENLTSFHCYLYTFVWF